MKRNQGTELPVLNAIFLPMERVISGQKQLQVSGMYSSFWTKDSASFNWEDRGRLEFAREYVYNSSCVKCHENLFPAKLTKAGEEFFLFFRIPS